MIVKFKKTHPDAQTPRYNLDSDGAMDLATVADGIVAGAGDGDYISYDTGVAVSVPNGYVGLLFPRSSISKYDLTLANSVGVLDSGYHAPITFRFKLTKPDGRRYYKGDRIGQLMIIERPSITMVEVDDLGTSERGTQGFGSSGA